MAGDGWFGRHKWRPYNDAGQVLSSGALMRICGKVAQYRRVRIHAHRRNRWIDSCTSVIRLYSIVGCAFMRTGVKMFALINVIAQQIAPLPPVRLSAASHGRNICARNRAIMHDSLRMRFLHCPVAQTVAARFIAHFNYRTAPSRRLQIMHYRLVQRIQLLFQQQKPFADDLLIFSALAGALDLPAQIIDLDSVNDLRRSAQPVQR